MTRIVTFIKTFRAKMRHILIGHLSFEHIDIEKTLDEIKLSLGKHEARSIQNQRYTSIQDAEFRVFSQFGQDGIIQYLIHKIPIKNKVFIELGSGDFSESNTRFLLMNNNWQGKIVDGNDSHTHFLQSEKGKDIRYRFDIQAITTFIDTKNINSIIATCDVPKDIGLLSIDIDGMDYWIWEAITTIAPRIVIIEYNSTFGADFPISVPYKKDFDRAKAHHSLLYFGASLKALCLLAKKKGYVFVGTTSAGNDAFFVRKDVVGKLPQLSVQQGYTPSRFRESKNKKGELTYVNNHRDRLQLIADKKVFDIQKKKLIEIGTVFQLNTSHK